MLNGKVYIGKTTKTLKERKDIHNRESRLGIKRLFYDAIRKYGFDAFMWEIIDTVKTERELNGKEIYWIEFYRSNVVKYGYKYGYNLTSGGQGPFGHISGIKNKTYEEFYGKEKAEQLKKERSLLYKGKSFEERFGKERAEQIQIKISISKKRAGKFSGGKNPMYNKTILDVWRKKYGEQKALMMWRSHKKKFKKINRGENNPMYGRIHKESSKNLMSKRWDVKRIRNKMGIESKSYKKLLDNFNEIKRLFFEECRSISHVARVFNVTRHYVEFFIKENNIRKERKWKYK
jgi:hypothetical protein